MLSNSLKYTSYLHIILLVCYFLTAKAMVNKSIEVLTQDISFKLFYFSCDHHNDGWLNRCCNEIESKRYQHTPTWLRFLCIVSSKAANEMFYPEPKITNDSFNAYLNNLYIGVLAYTNMSVLQSSAKRHLLFLPAVADTGYCSAPRELDLKNVQYSCRLNLEMDDWCSADTMISPLSYLLPYRFIKDVLPQVKLGSDYFNVAKINVSYICCEEQIDIYDAAKYKEHFSSNFIYLKTASCTDNSKSSLCKNNVPYNVTCHKCAIGKTIESLIPEIKIIEGDRVCVNAVFGIEYLFEEIDNISLKAQIFLTNIKLHQRTTYRIQILVKERISHLRSLQSGDNENQLRGYMYNEILGFGNMSASNISVIRNNNFGLWKTRNRLCTTDSVFPVKMQTNAFSGCLFEVELQDLHKCAVLRNRIFETQNRIMQSTLVAGIPFAKLDNLTQWIPIHRFKIKDFNNEKQMTEPVYTSEFPFKNFLEKIKCDYLPSLIYINVIYERTKLRHNRNPTYRILALNVNYSFTTAELNCDLFQKCEDDTKFLIQLTSQVFFTDVVQIHKRQYLANRYDILYPCHRDNCWTNIFHLKNLNISERFSLYLILAVFFVFILILKLCMIG